VTKFVVVILDIAEIQIIAVELGYASASLLARGRVSSN
jgi:hypothetical protein